MRNCQRGAELFLLDRRKRPLLKLNRPRPSGRVELYAGGRYYLRWEFTNATGKCEAIWINRHPP